MFNTSEYLERINFQGPVTLDKDCLERIHIAHLKTVPYENFDIIKGLNFDLNEESLFQKIVVRHRGGFCYEVNFLFARLLRELGFQVKLLSARIFNQEGALGQEYDHPILLVNLQERWLVDVGNARWFHKPICLTQRDCQIQNGVVYRIENSGNYYTLLQSNAAGDEKRQYRFSLKPRRQSAFKEMCDYKWTSPESNFTNGYIFSRLITEDIRVILTERKLLLVVNGARSEHLLNNRTEFANLLAEYSSEEYQKLVSIS